MALEIEPPGSGDRFAARRLGFYRRLGARVLPVDYAMPNLAGGDPLPMLLAWIGSEIPPLRALVEAVHATAYDLAVTDPLVAAVTGSIDDR